MSTWHTPSKDHALLIEAAISYGITHFDTAPVYGNGYAETILGDFASDITVATKIHAQVRNAPWHNAYSVDHIQHTLDGSIKRLKKMPEVIFMHNWNSTYAPHLDECKQLLKKNGFTGTLGVSLKEEHFDNIPHLSLLQVPFNIENQLGAQVVPLQQTWFRSVLGQGKLLKTYSLDECMQAALSKTPAAIIVGLSNKEQLEAMRKYARVS
jgi:aryl-alcohol dehydrogenase-like predicted oxidoreductase